MIFNALELENQDKYRLLTGGITPRPIAWISTRSKDGIDNLAPYSFFTGASCNPPVLLYTQVMQSSGANKDTLQNLIDTEECVVNIVNPALLEKMNITSASVEASVSEFDFADVQQCTSHHVAPKSVAESLVRYECTLREVISISDSPGGGSVVLLDVKYVYVQDALYQNGLIDQENINTIGKLGGDYYCNTSVKRELKRA